MREFDLDAAKRGEPVQTRAGRPARIVCWDKVSALGYRIVALLGHGDDEQIYTYCENGSNHKEEVDLMDLVMAPRKRVIWLNLYQDGFSHGHATQEIADEFAGPNRIGPARLIEIDE